MPDNQEEIGADCPTVEVKEELVTLLSEDKDIKNLLTMSFNETVISTYNSHFPKSQELQKLEKIHPGITAVMVEMMQKHQEHEMMIDKEMIKNESKRLNIIQTDVDKNHTTVRLGNLLGFLMGAGVLGLSGWLISLQQYGTAVSLIVGAGVIGTIVTSINGKTKKQDNES